MAQHYLTLLRIGRRRDLLGFFFEQVPKRPWRKRHRLSLAVIVAHASAHPRRSARSCFLKAPSPPPTCTPTTSSGAHRARRRVVGDGDHIPQHPLRRPPLSRDRQVRTGMSRRRGLPSHQVPIPAGRRQARFSHKAARWTLGLSWQNGTPTGTPVMSGVTGSCLRTRGRRTAQVGAIASLGR